MDEFVMKPHDPGQIRRHDGVALWRQIATTLQERIGAGTYAPGKQLPTEGELSRGFAVNRHTVRRALQELSRGGLIRIEQGRVLRLTEMAAPAQVAAGLGIRTGAKVVVLERLGLADDRPVSLGSHHFPATRFRGLLDVLRTTSTITEALRLVGVNDYMRQVTRVSARLPTPEEAILLRTTRTRPLLVTENVNVDQDGAIIEFGVALYPTPRVQIVFEP
jgi:GntR family phosphonate transport system transcriptional regulator